MSLNKPVSAIMTKAITSVGPLQKLIDVKHIFEKKNFHHHIPVIDNGNLIGMISLIDFIHAIKDAGLDDGDKVYHERFVRDIMTEHPLSKPSQTTIREIAEELGKGEIHAIAIADNNVLKGMVSTADIIRFFLKDQ
jgi:CBS domain-containing protein